MTRKQKDKERYLRNREDRIKKQKLYDLKHQEEKKKRTKEAFQKIKENPELYKKYNEKYKRFRVKRRLEILTHYSNGKMECACCGEKIIEFLAIDHVNNDGYAHRKIVKGCDLYRWLKNNNYPKGFQVLCHNCNFAKGVYGRCPHSCCAV